MFAVSFKVLCCVLAYLLCVDLRWRIGLFVYLGIGVVFDLIVFDLIGCLLDVFICLFDFGGLTVCYLL